MKSARLLVLGLLIGCAPPRATPAPPPAPATTSVRVGTSGDYPPLSVWRGDHAEGFAPELLATFGSRNRVALAWTRFAWPELASDLAHGRFDLAADGITVRPERSIGGRFTVPIARGGAVLLLHRPTWARGLDVRALDRPELRIVVNRGGHLERVTRSLFRSATITTLADNAGAREALAHGDADAAMTNTFEAPRWSQGLADVEQVGPLTRDVTALWVRADRPELAEQLDDWLLDEEASGRLQELRVRTLGPTNAVATARPLEALLAATLERLALMPFVARAKLATGKAVTDTAQETRVLSAAATEVERAATKHHVSTPPASSTGAFFRVQIEAAKDVQEQAPSASTTFSLDKELRPAIARITERMAFLVVRLPRNLHANDVIAVARDYLAESGVNDARIVELGLAIAALSAH